MNISSTPSISIPSPMTSGGKDKPDPPSLMTSGGKDKPDPPSLMTSGGKDKPVGPNQNSISIKA